MLWKIISHCGGNLAAFRCKICYKSNTCIRIRDAFLKYITWKYGASESPFPIYIFYNVLIKSSHFFGENMSGNWAKTRRALYDLITFILEICFFFLPFVQVDRSLGDKITFYSELRQTNSYFFLRRESLFINTFQLTRLRNIEKSI